MWCASVVLKIIGTVKRLGIVLSPLRKKKTKKYTVMKKVKCVKCGNEVEINIANAVDFNGEVYVCPECGYKFRFVDK